MTLHPRLVFLHIPLLIEKTNRLCTLPLAIRVGLVPQMKKGGAHFKPVPENQPDHLMLKTYRQHTVTLI